MALITGKNGEVRRAKLMSEGLPEDAELAGASYFKGLEHIKPLPERDSYPFEVPYR